MTWINLMVGRLRAIHQDALEEKCNSSPPVTIVWLHQACASIGARAVSWEAPPGIDTGRKTRVEAYGGRIAGA